MVPLNGLTAETILSDKILAEVFDQEDELYKSRLLLSLEDRAGELGVKKKFQEIVKAYKRVEREMRRKEREKRSYPTFLNQWTNFEGPYENMQCKDWIATEEGVCLRNPTTGFTDILACYHPILPIERLKNLETSKEQIRLAYKRNNRWEELIVPKTMITSANKIVSLSEMGIAVTSENAKYLVRYLADVENMNEEHIKVQYSTSKLGWMKDGGFLPYSSDIIFDGSGQFRQIYDSIESHGDRNAWYEHMTALRKAKRTEVKFMMAASFSSVLIKPLGGLPYFVDLWGESEGGKSIALAVAASVWACPNDNAYIKDYKGSDVGLEVLCDVLNHLPLMLDDSSKKNRKIEENFEDLVYSLCSGKGKTRSNKDLGLSRESHWKNCILTNGERPLNSYVNQGGAINRILEVECGTKVFDNPGKTSELIKRNYGHAGKEFVDLIKNIGIDAIKEIQQDFMEKLADDEKMQKQSLSLSIILTADKLITDYLFKDGQYISLEDARKVLIDRHELSDNERCYQFIMSEIDINQARFDPDIVNGERWGKIDQCYAYINVNAFDSMCKKGGFSKKAFLTWAIKRHLVQVDEAGKKTARNKKVGGMQMRCICLKMDDGIEVDENGFMSIDDGQLELPFK